MPGRVSFYAELGRAVAVTGYFFQQTLNGAAWRFTCCHLVSRRNRFCVVSAPVDRRSRGPDPIDLVSRIPPSRPDICNSSSSVQPTLGYSCGG